MLIGEEAAATGVSTKALRFYERQALLPQPDRAGLLGASGARVASVAAMSVTTTAEALQ